MRKLSLLILGAAIGAGSATVMSQTNLLSSTSAIAASADTYRQLGIVTICGTTILSGLLRDFITEDRWAIAAYIRALQLSQKAPLAVLTDQDRGELAAVGQ